MLHPPADAKRLVADVQNPFVAAKLQAAANPPVAAKLLADARKAACWLDCSSTIAKAAANQLAVAKLVVADVQNQSVAAKLLAAANLLAVAKPLAAANQLVAAKLLAATAAAARNHVADC